MQLVPGRSSFYYIQGPSHLTVSCIFSQHVSPQVIMSENTLAIFCCLSLLMIKTRQMGNDKKEIFGKTALEIFGQMHFTNLSHNHTFTSGNFAVMFLQRAGRQLPVPDGPDRRRCNVPGFDGVRPGKLQPSVWASVPVALPRGRHRRQRRAGEVHGEQIIAMTN